MTSINFHQSTSDNLQQGTRSDSADKGFFISIGVLVVTLLVWGGFKLYTLRIQGQNENMQAQVAQLQKDFSNDNVNKAIDFQQRLDAIKKNREDGSDINKTMDVIKGVIANNARLESFNQKGSALEMKLIGGDFLTVARQVLNFKSTNSLEDVTVSEISRTESGILFSVSANYKSNQIK